MMHWLPLLPPLVTIILALWSKRILPSLFAGLLLGSYLLKPDLIGGIETAVDYIVTTLSDEENLQVLLFLYLFSGLIGILKRSGGVTAASDFVGRYIKSRRGVLYYVWLLIPVTFIDCGFRIIGAASMSRSLAEKQGVSKERLAFMLNNTASPIVELVPIATTFVGFNVANIGQGLRLAGVADVSAYGTLLRAIPLEFFSIAVLVLTFTSIFFEWRIPVKQQKTHAKESAENMSHMHIDMEGEQPEIRPRLFNIVMPMLAIVGLSIFFYWYFGVRAGGAVTSIAAIITATDPNKAMLVALLISLLLTGAAYFFQKYSTKKMIADIFVGGNEIVPILAVIVTAWALAAVAQDLGLSEFIRQQLGNSLPGWILPVTLFLISSAVTYAIGEGWATAALIMPFAIALAVSSGAGIPLCVAAVITGGTFGDVTSPVAGMTNMSSNAAHADHSRYLRYAGVYNFSAAGIAAVLFLVFGLLQTGI